MIVSTETIIVVVGSSVMTGGFGIIGFMVRSVLKKLDGMVSEKLCTERRSNHDKDHERVNKDIDNIADLARGKHRIQ